MAAHIALIFGGPSSEHEVSLCSAKNIYEVLRNTPFQVSLLGVTKRGDWRLIEDKSLETTGFHKPLLLEDQGFGVELIPEKGRVFICSKGKREKTGSPLDCAFPIIHGNFGEDGQLQSLLRKLGLTFVGSHASGCEKAFDKTKTKELIAQTQVPQVPYLNFVDCEPDFDKVVSLLGLPFFIKPARTGSSIGISKVTGYGEFKKAFLKARDHDKKILIEKAVCGRELEFAVLENKGIRITGPGEIRTKHEFYSYEAKYLDPRGAKLIIPAQVEPATLKKLQEYALTCFKTLDCNDYARVDFFLSDRGEIFFNELNTHPGFTNISQFPLLWQQEGLSYEELILILIERAMNKR